MPCGNWAFPRPEHLSPIDHALSLQAVSVVDPNLQTADAPISNHRFVERPLLAINIARLSLSAAGGEELPAERWLRWAGDALRQVLSRHEGQIVRDTGTGLVMSFEDAHHCLQAAFALSQLADSLNAQADGSRQLHLHAVAHLAQHPCGQKSRSTETCNRSGHSPPGPDPERFW